MNTTACVMPQTLPLVPVSYCETFCTYLLDDFESVTLTGWTTGILDTSNTQSFTSFLGSYGSSVSPENLYTGIPTTATMLKLEFDFYEIDS